MDDACGLPLFAMRRFGAHRSRAVALAALAALAGACAPPSTAVDIAAGELGPFGVHVERRWLGESYIEADVFVPDEEDRSPPVIFVQGGLISLERYRWLGSSIAAHGAVVASPTHPLDLAFFAQDRAAAALAGLRSATEDRGDDLFGRVADVAAVVVGHSLGGVVASKAFLHADADEIASLALLASYPDPADFEALSGRSLGAGRVLSLVGDHDEKSDVGAVARGALAFERSDVIVIDGMNHYQWTDDATESELDSDGTPTRSDAQVRASALPFLVSLVDEVCACGRPPYAFEHSASWPAGARRP